MSLFVLASKDGWVNIMYTGLDAVGVDQQVSIVPVNLARTQLTKTFTPITPISAHCPGVQGAEQQDIVEPDCSVPCTPGQRAEIRVIGVKGFASCVRARLTGTTIV